MPNRLQGGAEVMKLEVVVTSAKVIKCSFLLQCAKTFNSNPGNPIHTESFPGKSVKFWERKQIHQEVSMAQNRERKEVNS